MHHILFISAAPLMSELHGWRGRTSAACCLPVLQETAAFAKAQTLDQHKALVHIFFAQRSTKRVKGVTDAGLKPRGIKKLAVLGGGLMGSGIATASILAGIEVLLKEINQKFLEVCVPMALHAQALARLQACLHVPTI